MKSIDVIEEMKFASMITSTDQKTGDWGDNKDTDEEILKDINSTKPPIEFFYSEYPPKSDCW